MKKRVLEGIKVLDFTRFFTGPFSTMLLGDYGADVIKIESPKGDTEREQGPPFVGDQSVGFIAVNRNKQSVVLDLKTEEGKRLAQSLIKEADIIVENFKLGVTEKLGIDFKTASRLNPNIIYCEICGYGRTGPHAKDPGFDLTIQAFSGFMSLNGIPDGEPVKPAVSIVDLITGLYAFAGIEAALIIREKDKEKKPQLISTSLLECNISFLVDAAIRYLLDGTERKALGSHHPNIAPYGAFRAADGWLTIGAGHQHIWECFCKIIDVPGLISDKRFLEAKDRIRNHKQLVTILEKELCKKNVNYWVERFLKAGIPSAPVNSIGTALDSQQIKSRDMIINLKHPILGNMRLLGPAVKQQGIDIGSWYAPPMLGEHTFKVLHNTLNISHKKLCELAEKKVIYDLNYSLRR